jgi:hypothetical protein
MRFGVRLPGPFFAVFGRSARGQARRNLHVRAHERDILAGHRTVGEEIGVVFGWMIKAFLVLALLLLPFVLAWMAISHVANDINPNLHWRQTYRVANCNISLAPDYPAIAPTATSGPCPQGGTWEPAGWHY